jgi:hypothetical protein
MEAFVNWIAAKLPLARLEERFHSHAVFDLPIGSSEVGGIFTLMEMEARSHGLADYGLSQSTLEQVREG